MIQVLGHYLLFLLILQPIEEFYTCDRPNTIGTELPHFFCDWEDEDFIEYAGGKRILKPRRESDNFIKRYYRNKYWIIRKQGAVFKSKRDGVGVITHPLLLGV